MAATTITGPINNVNNDPFANKWVKFTLGQLGTDATAGVTVAQSSDSVQTDASGDFSIDIWDNGESGIESILEVKIEGSRPQYVIIPQGTVSIELWDLIENYPAADADPQLPVTSELFLEKGANLSDLSDLSQSRDNLGVQIGVDVQAHDDKLDDISEITPTDGTFLVGNGVTFVPESGDTAQKSLGVQTPNGGGQIGDSSSSGFGGAVGSFSVSSGGGAVGATSSAVDGGAVGALSSATDGGAVGKSSQTITGGAVGLNAASTSGFAGGNNAVANGGVDRVQLGTGTNLTDSTIQFLDSGSVTAAEFGTLAGATASYTVAEENKLAGIETGAEVNDPDTLVSGDIGTTVQAYLEPLNTIETTITDTDVAIPTSGAVVGYAQPINQTDIWTFSNSTGESDPGSGIFRLNNGTQSSSTAIYLSKTSKSGESHDFTDLVVGAEFRITEAGSLDGHTVEVTSAFTDNGTWVSIPISVINTVGSLGNNNDALFQQVFGASSLGNQRNLTSPTTLVTSTPYTITAEDRILLIDDDTVGGDVTINIPPAATLLNGWSITIKKLGSTGDIILDPNGSETIDGATTRTVRQKLESTCLVSDGSNWQVMFPTTPTGWAIYVDDTYTSGSPLVLTNAVRNLLTINGNGSTTNTDFLPAGVTNFWDTTNNKITPQKVGDAYDLRIDFSVDVPANTESITLELDIGDGSPDIPVVTRGIQFSESGAGQLVSVGFPIFALTTFLANGGKIYLTPSTVGFDIYDIQIFIKRDFSPL